MNGFDSAATQYENRTPEDCGWLEEPESECDQPKPIQTANRKPSRLEDFDPFLED